VNFSTVVGTTGIKSLPVGILDGFFLLVVFTASAVKYGTTIKLLEVFLGFAAGLTGTVLFAGLIVIVVFDQPSSTGRVLFATGIIVSGILKVSFTIIAEISTLLSSNPFSIAV
jgi:hypothetical protein